MSGEGADSPGEEDKTPVCPLTLLLRKAEDNGWQMSVGCPSADKRWDSFFVTSEEGQPALGAGTQLVLWWFSGQL